MPLIDHLRPSLLATFSAIKRCFWVIGLHFSCGAYHTVAEVKSWLKSDTDHCTDDTYLGPAIKMVILLFEFLLTDLVCCSATSLLCPTKCIHMSVKKKAKCLWWSSKWKIKRLNASLERNSLGTGISRETGYHQRDISWDSVWLHATLQCKSLLLMAN